VAAKSGFTRIPKVQHLVLAGVPVEAIPTYCALADHANNKNGLCWPKMQTLARILGRCARTVQRHLHLLKELGLVEFVSRRRYRGRFGSYLYRVLAVPGMARKKRAPTTGHGRRLGDGPPIFTRTKEGRTPPSNPPTEGYEWLFGSGLGSGASSDAENITEKEQYARSERARRRAEGYEWLLEG
jgi:DNA-binding transcriptional ArsR family regulator